MQIPGVYIETIRNPALYSEREISNACKVAAQLNRGKLVLCIEPKR